MTWLFVQIRQKRKDLLMAASEQIRQQSRDLKKELDREIDLKLRMKIKEHENERVKLRTGSSNVIFVFELWPAVCLNEANKT